MSGEARERERRPRPAPLNPKKPRFFPTSEFPALLNLNSSAGVVCTVSAAPPERVLSSVPGLPCTDPWPPEDQKYLKQLFCLRKADLSCRKIVLPELSLFFLHGVKRKVTNPHKHLLHSKPLRLWQGRGHLVATNLLSWNPEEPIGESDRCRRTGREAK